MYHSIYVHLMDNHFSGRYLSGYSESLPNETKETAVTASVLLLTLQVRYIFVCLMSTLQKALYRLRQMLCNLRGKCCKP